MRGRDFAAGGIATALTLVAVGAAAQPAPGPGGPPPGYEQQYQGQPPPGYPPGYYPPPPGAAPQGPKVMDYDEGQAVPPGYHVESRVRKGFVIGGATTFGALYLFSIFTGALASSVSSLDGSRDKGWDWMYVPVAGPFVTIAATNQTQGSGIFWLALLGVGQTLGAGLLVTGIAAPQDKLVRNDASLPRIHVTPTIAKGYVGLGVTGSM